MTLAGSTILIAEDDPDQQEILRRHFTLTGAKVITATNGRDALRQFFLHQPQLVILDLFMPEMDGLQTCWEIKQIAGIPIILISASTDEDTMVEAFNHGAEDYVTKPYRTKELIARVKRLMKFSEVIAKEPVSRLFKLGDLEVDLQQRTVHTTEGAIHLTNKEFLLFCYFIENEGKLLLMEQILRDVWGWKYRDHPEYVHVFVSRLRKKLQVDTAKTLTFINEHGVGYRFVADIIAAV